MTRHSQHRHISDSFEKWIAENTDKLATILAQFGLKDACEVVYFAGYEYRDRAPLPTEDEHQTKFKVFLFDEKRQQSRHELWSRVYAASVNCGNQFWASDPIGRAYQALKAFDERFNSNAS